MNNSTKIACAVAAPLLFLLGLTLGAIWKDIPNITLNHEIKVYEVANLFVVVIIGTVYPFLIKKWIDDNRTIKASLVDEVKTVLSKTNEIKLIIDNTKVGVALSQEGEDQINFLFSDIDMCINSFDEQMKEAFPNQKEAVVKLVKDANQKYWKFTSGEPLMTSTFVMTDSYRRDHVTQYELFSKSLKVVIQKIYKL